MSIVDFVIDTICLAVSPDRPEWMIPLLGWKFFKQVVNTVSQPFKAVGNAISGAGKAVGNIASGIGKGASNVVGALTGGAKGPTVTVVGGTSAAQQAENDKAIKALQAKLDAEKRAAAKAEAKRQRDAAIAAENESAATAQNASVQRASGRLSAMNTAQMAADAAAGQTYALANTSIGNVGGGFDINAARLQALSNVGGAGGGGAMSSAMPYMAPSNVAPAIVAAANLESGGRNVRSNRFNIPATDLTYGGT
jgi:hypothetical protein